MKARAKTPASMGELIQGKIDGKEMLVSCPINIYSLVEIEILEGYGIKPHYKKVYKAFEIFLKRYGIYDIKASDIKLSIYSDIPRSKGMASSTADISSSLVALSRVLSISLSEEEIASLAVEAEPTDSTVFSQLTLYDHLYGKKIERIGPYLPIELLLLEGKEMVDTLEFRKDKDYLDLVPNLDEQYEKLKEAVKDKDIKSLGEVCTESAFANQKLLYKPYLEELFNMAMDYNSPGIITGHSGSVSGIIINDDTDKAQLLHNIREAFGFHFNNIYFTHTVKGGTSLVF